MIRICSLMFLKTAPAAIFFFFFFVFYHNQSATGATKHNGQIFLEPGVFQTSSSGLQLPLVELVVSLLVLLFMSCFFSWLVSKK